MAIAVASAACAVFLLLGLVVYRAVAVNTAAEFDELLQQQAALALRYADHEYDEGDAVVPAAPAPEGAALVPPAPVAASFIPVASLLLVVVGSLKPVGCTLPSHRAFNPHRPIVIQKFALNHCRIRSAIPPMPATCARAACPRRNCSRPSSSRPTAVA